MPRYVIIVEHAIEAATPEDVRATLEARLVGLDRELTAREHGEAPARAAWALRGVWAEDETDEGGAAFRGGCSPLVLFEGVPRPQHHTLGSPPTLWPSVGRALPILPPVE